MDGVLAFDKDRDVAVIKAHGNNFQILALGDSDRLEVGEEVVAIGSPLSLESTVSNGIVSGIRTDGEEDARSCRSLHPSLMEAVVDRCSIWQEKSSASRVALIWWRESQFCSSD